MSCKKRHLLFILTTLSLAAFGQQDPQFSHSMYSHMAINPGFAGSSNMINITAINRQQWVGFADNAFNTTSVSVDAAIKPFGFSSGVGLSILSDNIGFDKNLGLNLTYAARFNVGKGKLGVGISGGFINNSLDPVWIPPISGDNSIPTKKESSINLDLGFGLFYNTESMFFGVSATHLNETQRTKAIDPAHYSRNYYVSGGYRLELNPSWEFAPSVHIATDLVVSQFSFSAALHYNKKFWGGVSYRVGEAVVGMVGIELFNGLRVGYAYDYALSKIGSYNDGSHEFLLGYSFSLRKERPPQQYKSIRFL